MPHSPRWYNDRLWVHNSGAGEFSTIDLDAGKFQAVAFCPGCLRGLSFVGDYAVVTLSKPRHSSFHRQPLDDQREKRKAEPQCGLQIIDLNTGTIAHWLRLDDSQVTFTFNETPSDFTADDVTVQNAMLSGLAATGDPLVFTATFTPTAGV